MKFLVWLSIYIFPILMGVAFILGIIYLIRMKLRRHHQPTYDFPRDDVDDYKPIVNEPGDQRDDESEERPR